MADGSDPSPAVAVSTCTYSKLLLHTNKCAQPFHGAVLIKGKGKPPSPTGNVSSSGSPLELTFFTSLSSMRVESFPESLPSQQPPVLKFLQLVGDNINRNVHPCDMCMTIRADYSTIFTFSLFMPVWVSVMSVTCKFLLIRDELH